MAQRKAHEVDAWLARPDNSTTILIYGPDRGLVSERAAIFAKGTGLPLDDAFAVIRYDGSSLESDPVRLIEEAHMVPMFGGRRLIWIRNAPMTKPFSDAIAQLLAEPPADAQILMEGGDLKKTSPLRTSVEKAKAGMALPCFQDEARTIETLIDQALSEAGQNNVAGRKARPAPRLGGDRLASRGEIQKLILYAGDAQEISVEDVEMSTGDAAAISGDAAIDAALTGDLKTLDIQLSRAFGAGTHAQVLLGGALRQFQMLHLLRRDVELGGVQTGTAIAGARPPIFFARRKTMETVLTRWRMTMIERAISRLNDAILQTRKRPDLSPSIVRQALLALAIESGRAGRGR